MKTALGKGFVRLLLLLSPMVLAGCLTSRAPEVACWNLEYAADAAKADARLGVVRVSQVVVRAPYAAKGIAVLRANGTIAFDPYNEYAAGPAALLKGVVSDVMVASGLFKAVVSESSSVKASLLAEVTVTRLAIDCREEGVRRASAELLLQLVDGREISAAVKGAGAADAADGNYGAALSRAVTDALAAALGQL